MRYLKENDMREPCCVCGVESIVTVSPVRYEQPRLVETASPRDLCREHFEEYQDVVKSGITQVRGT